MSLIDELEVIADKLRSKSDLHVLIAEAGRLVTGALGFLKHDDVRKVVEEAEQVADPVVAEADKAVDTVAPVVATVDPAAAPVATEVQKVADEAEGLLHRVESLLRIDE